MPFTGIPHLKVRMGQNGYKVVEETPSGRYAHQDKEVGFCSLEEAAKRAHELSGQKRKMEDYIHEFQDYEADLGP